jgi:hypothetical protein
LSGLTPEILYKSGVEEKQEEKNMAKENSRRFTSLVMTALFIFSAMAVMNFASTNVRAADETIWWDYGYTVNATADKWFPRPGYDSCTIIMRWGNLTIESGYTLTFNDSVTFEIWNNNPGDHGIDIENNGMFIVDSSSADTSIKSDTSNPDKTYWFLNSGTLDFTGATA